jgi:hypothetical protein
VVVIAMTRSLLLILTLCAAASAAAAQISVHSPRADAVSITIYRDGLALITETREIDMPAEPATLVFEGVVDSLLPQSAVLSGADRPLAESNFTFDPLTAASLIQRSVGRVVTLIRTQQKTGRVTRVEATIVSAGDGVLLKTLEGNEALYCSGIPERLELSEIPGDLTSKPVLSVRLAAGAAGKRTLKLSYLAHGFSWQSNYVGQLNARGDRMALTGWVTLQNESSSSFRDAQVQLVAGKLNLLDPEDGGSSPARAPYDDYDDEAEPGISVFDEMREEEEDAAQAELDLLGSCYSVSPSLATRVLEGSRSWADVDMGSSSELESVMVTGSRRVERESFGDYQLYRLPWATDLNARQTKQAVFLDKRRVRVDRFYSVSVAELEGLTDEARPPHLVVRFENKSSAGLGEPLPKGTVRIFEPYGDGQVFAGEAELDDKPVGLPVELAFARALNVTAEVAFGELEEEEEQEEELSDESEAADSDEHRVSVAVACRFVNDKEVPITLEVRHTVDSDWGNLRVVRSNLRAGRKYGDITWRFRVQPGAEQRLRYILQATRIY